MKILSLSLLLACHLPAAALGSRDKGTTAAAFLTLTPGARASALGGAFSGLADDALSAHYNPAGLGFAQGLQGSAGRESRFQGLNYDYAILAVPVLAWTDKEQKPSEWGTAALSVYSLTATGIERRGVVESDSPTGTFAAADRAFALSYGKALSEEWALGATLKYVDRSLDTARASAVTEDLGALWKREAWSAGAGVRNAYGKMALGSYSDPLPTVLFAGGAWKPRAGWLVAAEIDQPRYDATALAFGVERELEVTKGLNAAVRAGYRTDRMDQGVLGGATIGFGVGFKGFNADVAWSPGGSLGDVVQYSLRAKF